MATITIATTQIPNWQRDNDVHLRVYANQPFIAADGTVVSQGNPSENESDSGNFFFDVPCTLSGSTLIIPVIVLPSTDDSQDNPDAEYSAWFYTSGGERIAVFGEFALFFLPSSSANTTWAAIALAQKANS